MNHVYMCGHTGVINRGCEAIVRSTVKVLGGKGGGLTLMSFTPDRDLTMVKNIGINILPYAKYPNPIVRYGCAAMRKVFKHSNCGQSIVQKPLFSRLNKEDLCLNIGGDTYCYNRPVISYALNQFTSKRDIPNILWCCSIDPDCIKGEMLEDLKKYTYIFAREQITYEALIADGIPPQKVIKCCDPAFFLDSKEVALPKNFVCGNTVGINISEVVVKPSNPEVYRNVIEVIRYILNYTNMSICLIPHVYSIKEMKCDYPILKQIMDEIDDDRISIVDQEYTCEELKFIISKCRFFIGARTHATIAAYSSFIPTLVIGYSVKSKGIAKDLFGTYEGYVIPYTSLTQDNELLLNFKKLIANELQIRQRLSEIMPIYKSELSSAIEKYIKPLIIENDEFEICRKELCSGCAACMNVCPNDCIKMQTDEEGFDYPEIDYKSCVKCGKCKQVCPVLNKPIDDNVAPRSYAVWHKNEEIRHQSSSGGAFSLFAEYVISQGGAVFGAGYADDFSVKHTMIESIEEISHLRGSKYVQSKIGETYKQVKNILNQNRVVLFTGTPCQIAGLYAYLGNIDSNLITIDFICHGVPSSAVWKKYLEENRKAFQAKIESISFRDKSMGWQNFSLKIQYNNGKVYSKTVKEDLYLKGFVANLYLRPSCSVCSFKEVHRQSDISLADFWGVNRIHSEFNDDKGISLILLHSNKGKDLLDSISSKAEIHAIEYNEAIVNNPSYYLSVSPFPARKQFFKKLNSMPIKKLKKIINYYLGTGLVCKARRAIIRFFG